VGLVIIYKHAKEFTTPMCMHEFTIRAAIHTWEMQYLCSVYSYTNFKLLDTHSIVNALVCL